MRCRPPTRWARPACRLGTGVAALVVELHTEKGMPLAKVAHLLRTRFGLHVTPGALAHLLHRTARAAPTYTALCEQVRNAPVVTPDETGWRVGAGLHWLWAFVTPETTVYAICPGRGFDDATTVLGADFAGVLVRDGWVSYRCYRAALHQSCLGHLLRRCKQLQEDHPDDPWATEVQAVLQAGLDLRDRCNDGELTEHGLASARGRLIARLGRLIDTPAPLDDAERFARHLGHRIRRRVPLPVGPVDRRHQLARRTGHPARRRHPQGVRRQPHPQGRRHPAGAGQCRAHRPPTRPRPALADRHDAARPRPGRSRRLWASAAARVRGRPGTTAFKRDRSPGPGRRDGTLRHKTDAVNEESFRELCGRHLPAMVSDKVTSLRVRRWVRRSDSREGFHARYAVTDRGGYGLDKERITRILRIHNHVLNHRCASNSRAPRRARCREHSTSPPGGPLALSGD